MRTIALPAGLMSFLLLALLLSPRPLFAAEEVMAAAAAEFLHALSAGQRERAVFALEADERLRWHFVPDEMHARNGIALKDLDAAQQGRAHALLQSGLSQSGYLTANAIMALERVLAVLESNGRFVRDHENYRLTLFGTPAADGTWAWRFEGHHLSLHFQVVAGAVTVSTPSFFGSNPAHVTEGAQTPEQQGQRVLGAREDAGRRLVTALNAVQRLVAIISESAPRDIVTGAEYPIDPLAPAGVPAADLEPGQRQLLRALIRVYTDAMAADIAAARWAKIERDGFDSIAFAWAGSLDAGEPHYYRVQGPSFLIEYDNVQNGANHVHSVWRDFDGDFGEDLLRAHYADQPH